jgi:hypothetical protein
MGTSARAAALVLGLVLAWFPAAGRARDVRIGDAVVRLDVTSTTGAAWRVVYLDPGERRQTYGELVERLNLGAATGPWILGLRLDTTTFISSPSPLIVDRYTLEKAWVGWTSRSVELVAGDAYVSLGRGLSLSLRKQDELGVDTTLRGAKALVHHGAFGGTLLAGYANIQNMDETTGQGVDDPYDLIAGAQANLTLGPATVGIQGSAVAFRSSLGVTPEPAYSDRFYQYGPMLDIPRLGEHFGLYLEGIAQTRDGPGRDGKGFGGYGAATVYAGPLTVLVEGKAYGKLEPLKPNLANPAFSYIVYNTPPTLERVLQPLEHTQSEVYGGRVRLDLSFPYGMHALLNYGTFRDAQGYADPAATGQQRPGNIHDPYAGFDGHWNGARSRAGVMLGRRTVHLSGTRAHVRVDDHVQADVVHTVGAHWNFEVHLLHAERKKDDSAILRRRFREGTLLVSLRYRPHVGLAVGYDYTTDPTQRKVRYFSGNLDWEIHRAALLRLFVGSQRGGLRCLSGVCRTLPPFEGVKLVATLRY